MEEPVFISEMQKLFGSLINKNIYHLLQLHLHILHFLLHFLLQLIDREQSEDPEVEFIICNKVGKSTPSLFMKP